jgi:hypothetical protein
MSLVHLLLVLVILGVILWLINSYLPIDDKLKMVINVIAVIFVIVWLAQSFGLLGSVMIK